MSNHKAYVESVMSLPDGGPAASLDKIAAGVLPRERLRSLRSRLEDLADGPIPDFEPAIEAAGIVERLAMRDPPLTLQPGGSPTCGLCEAVAPLALRDPVAASSFVVFGFMVSTDPTWHAERCPWRMAREWNKG